MAYKSNLAYKDEENTAIEEIAVRRPSKAANDDLRYAEAANDSTSRDASRGIRKVVVTPKNPSGEYVADETTGPRVEEFEREESVAGRAKNKRLGKAANDEMSEAEYFEEMARATAVEEVREIASERAQKQVATNATLGNAKKMRGFALWAGLGAVWTIYLWQLTFAVISLIGYGIMYAVASFTETIPGKFLSWFIDFNKYIPGDILGGVFWGLGVILAFATFFGFTLWYYFSGVNPFATFASTSFTLLALAFCVLPVLNLVPWLPFWVFYMNTRSTASMLHLFENG